MECGSYMNGKYFLLNISYKPEGNMAVLFKLIALAPTSRDSCHNSN